MSPAYIKAVTENLPDAKIVFDHFHVIKLYNEKLSDFRRMLFNTTHEILKKTVLKGSRWLLLTAREKLSEKHNPVPDWKKLCSLTSLWQLYIT